MADINWPVDLPRYFRADSLRMGFKPSVSRFQPAIGAARSRRRSTVSVFRVRGTIYLRRIHPVRTSTGRFLRNVDQAEMFLEFVTETIAEGVKRFNWVDPMNLPPNYDGHAITPSMYNVEMLLVNGDTAGMLSAFAGSRDGDMTAALDLEMYKTG